MCQQACQWCCRYDDGTGGGSCCALQLLCLCVSPIQCRKVTTVALRVAQQSCVGPLLLCHTLPICANTIAHTRLMSIWQCWHVSCMRPLPFHALCITPQRPTAHTAASIPRFCSSHRYNQHHCDIGSAAQCCACVTLRTRCNIHKSHVY